MPESIRFPHEEQSNATRATLEAVEPKSLRTFTPSQAVFTKSAGVFHWTSEGRRLYDYSSGVLVSNLGHNPQRWLKNFWKILGWDGSLTGQQTPSESEYLPAAPLTAYNALTEIEATATERLVRSLQSSSRGQRLQQVMWSASGSEAVQKALWACLARDEKRDLIIATRYGFHGKKGLAGAVTGCESDKNRDPRVRFISFPMQECDDLENPSKPFDLDIYQRELDVLLTKEGKRINCLITEPYLGGGGSYHPPKEYHQLLERWCRDNDIMLIFDEVQSNFGRTGTMYAFEAYEIEPDFICLGKGLGNGVPVSAAVGPREILSHLNYGEASDTWSANPLSCASVIATLDEFESTPILQHTRDLFPVFAEGLLTLKQSGLIARIRGEGLVFGIECQEAAGLSANEVANAIVREAYLGEDGGDGIHLLGPLAGKVIRISPPMTITFEQAQESLALLDRFVQRTAERLKIR